MLEKFLERVTLTKGIPEVIALGAGAYKGYCDSQGIPISPEFFNQSLKFAPIAVHAIIGGLLGFGLDISEREEYNTIREGLRGAATGTVETGLGYCIGHTIGSLMK